jgi:hypothetical protein
MADATIDGPPRRRDTWSIRRIAEEIGGRPIADFQEPLAPRRAPTASSWSPPKERLPAGFAAAMPSPAPRVPSPAARAAPSARARAPIEPVAPTARPSPPTAPPSIPVAAASFGARDPDPVDALGETEASSDDGIDPVARVYPPLTRENGRALHGAEHEHHVETLERHGPDPAALEPGERPHRPGPSTRPERIYLHYLLLHLDRLSDHALAYLERAVSEEILYRERGPTPEPAPLG